MDTSVATTSTLYLDTSTAKPASIHTSKLKLSGTTKSPRAKESTCGTTITTIKSTIIMVKNNQSDPIGEIGTAQIAT